MRTVLASAALLLAAIATAAAQGVETDGRRCLSFNQGALDPDAALQACTAAIDSGRAPEGVMVSLFFTRAHILVSVRKDYRAAIADYTSALRVSQVPGLTAGMRIQRAVAFLALSELESAVEDLTAGLEAPALPHELRHLAHGERGIARMRLAKEAETADRERKLTEAEADLTRAIDLNPAYARGHFARGVLRQWKAAGPQAASMSAGAVSRLLDAAEADLREARRLDPDVQRPLMWAGIIAAPARGQLETP